MVDRSLQCMSSNTSTNSSIAAMVSIASTISRSMRSTPLPATLRCNAACSASSSSPGSWSSQTGAWRRNNATTSCPPACRHNRPTASSTGRYGSPAPCCSTHSPRAMREGGSCARKASTSALLPIPASPPMKTSWRCPAAALEYARFSRASSAPRPTIGDGGSLVRDANADGSPRQHRPARRRRAAQCRR